MTSDTSIATTRHNRGIWITDHLRGVRLPGSNRLDLMDQHSTARGAHLSDRSCLSPITAAYRSLVPGAWWVHRQLLNRITPRRRIVRSQRGLSKALREPLYHLAITSDH